MYIDNDLLDTLLPLTYSCEAVYGNTQFDKVKLDTLISPGIHEEEHCGRCWFCLERAYAFGRLV
jgi:7-cyano-7-deazaguanine synthase in queuosine biosynthesis